MPITQNTLEQVQCNACLKYMSEKNLRYSHPKYCLERSTIDTPSEIPIPNLNFKNDEAIKHKIVLPVKSVTMKRTRTVTVDNTPIIEEETHTPIIIKPSIEKVLNQHEIFKNQMDARIQIRKEKYNTLLVGTF